MGLKDPNMIFGVHSITPYSRTDGSAYGTAKVVGSFDAAFSGDLVEQSGGSSKYPWGVEEGKIKSDLKVQFKEYADWMFQLFLGKLPTTAGVDTTGTISTLTNIFGTSVKNTTTGVSAVIVVPSTGAADLKFTKYLLKAASATTVDVYAMTDIDFNRGTSQSFIDNTLKIASALTVPDSAGHVDVPGFGLRLSSGSGTIAMITGDTASFEVLPPATSSMSVVVGGTSATFPEFGCIAMAQRRGSGQLCEIDIYRCKGIGLPISFKEKAWSDAQVTAMALYDSVKDGVYKLRLITP